MKYFWILIIIIILNVFARYKIYAKIEKFFLEISTKKIAFVGIIFISIGLGCFLLGSVEVEKDLYVTGFDLVFKYCFVFAQILFVAHILILGALFFNKLVDRFRYATLFAAVNLLSWFILGMVEIPKRFMVVPYADYINLLMGLSPLITLVCILIFGLESKKTEPKSKFFKFIKRYNSKIQRGRDEAEKRWEHYDEDKMSVSEKYKRTAKVFSISAIIFVVMLISWILIISYIPSASGVTGYIGLGILFGVYLIWLFSYFRNKKF